MQKLNIPIGRTHKTTRRHRRVVLPLIVILLIVFLLLLHISGIWFTRNRILSAAPVDTDVAIQLSVNKGNIKTIYQLFSEFPLISNRSFTLKDLLPYTKGEIGVFFGTDGSRSVALVAKKEELPMNLFDTHRLVVQEIGSNVVLLSEKLVPIGSMRKKTQFFSRFIPHPSSKHLGSIVFAQQDHVGLIRSTSDRLFIKLKNVSYQKIDHQLPDNTYAFMSTPVLPKTVMDQILPSFSGGLSLEPLFTSKGWLFLNEIEEKKTFLLTSDGSQKFDREDILKTIASRLNPKIKTRRLPDGSVTKELVIDPGLISLEQRSIQGRTFLSVRTPGGEEFYLSADDDVIFSNSESNIRSLLSPDENRDVLSICNANSFGLDLKKILEQTRGASTFYSNSLLINLGTTFSRIGMKSGKNNGTMNICF